MNFYEFVQDYPIDDNGYHYILIPDFPTDPESTQHKIRLSDKIYINKFDYTDSEIKTKHYLTKISPVILRHLGVMMKIISEEKVIDNLGNKKMILSVTLQKVTSKKSYKKHKVLTWLISPIKIQIQIIDNLLNKEDLNEDDDLSACVNSNSLLKTDAFIETSFFNELKINTKFSYGQSYQAERFGYITLDEKSCDNYLIFNMTCFLNIHEELKANILLNCHPPNKFPTIKVEA